jgi:hypothetical protein
MRVIGALFLSKKKFYQISKNNFECYLNSYSIIFFLIKFILFPSKYFHTSKRISYIILMINYLRKKRLIFIIFNFNTYLL